MMTCGTCGFTWDDSVVTDRTPAPSPRTPCEYYHILTYGEEFGDPTVEIDWDEVEADRDFINVVHGGWS